ncbi:DUF2884 family protein [Gallaecimonas sp. GXIMD1310]|uniref:DUF2884 family protein n=1 Tax=Gallaecimonas sp. GXIMD1310 TaxID=3131926 RepID=UPI003243FA45
MKKVLYFLPALLLCGTAMADNIKIDDQCSLNMPHDLTVNAHSFTVQDSNKTLMRFDNGQLWLNSSKQQLSKQQHQQLTQFNQSLYAGVQSGAKLAQSALKLAREISDTVVTEMLGADAGQSISTSLNTAEQHIHKKLYQQDGTWHLGAGNLDNGMDQAFGEQFEKQIKTAVQKSLGSLFTQLGKVMSSDEGGDMESRLDAWSKNMEAKADKIDKIADKRSNELSQQAEDFCQQVKAIDAQDNALKDSIPGWIEVVKR